MLNWDEEDFFTLFVIVVIILMIMLVGVYINA